MVVQQFIAGAGIAAQLDASSQRAKIARPKKWDTEMDSNARDSILVDGGAFNQAGEDEERQNGMNEWSQPVRRGMFGVNILTDRVPFPSSLSVPPAECRTAATAKLS